ncbi:LOW QUALITY PROTEIN: fibronectin type III domain-containing protein 3B-like [Petromyzon marinus]|uniref:LOW QUALITY PROTEIN: fibronectin type III domain-containing protein 3B-like n=1 Tax=Petromyzon marinus TaxID=7757 RepID=UPI003F720E03
MYMVAMMMMDQPLLEAPPLLSPELPPPLVPMLGGGEATQQVILVQVNPGETFTIQAEDGTVQCIPGPAHVPMMSTNGSIPPIHVPPGYISQIIEENGVWKVVVTPHPPEFHPHPSMHPPPPPLPPYMQHHPPLLTAPPPPPHAMYPPPGPAGEMPPPFMAHHPPPPPPPPPPHAMYTEQEAIPPPLRPSYYQDRLISGKPHGKKLGKPERLGGGERMSKEGKATGSSPPNSPQNGGKPSGSSSSSSCTPSGSPPGSSSSSLSSLALSSSPSSSLSSSSSSSPPHKPVHAGPPGSPRQGGHHGHHHGQPPSHQPHQHQPHHHHHHHHHQQPPPPLLHQLQQSHHPLTHHGMPPPPPPHHHQQQQQHQQHKAAQQPLSASPAHGAVMNGCSQRVLPCNGGIAGGRRTDRRSRGSPRHTDGQDAHCGETDVELRKPQDAASSIGRPQVTNVQARSALLSWSPPAPPPITNGHRPCPGGGGGGSPLHSPPCPRRYEVSISESGGAGAYQVIYSGEDREICVRDLRPATDYHVRVSTVCASARGSCSDSVGFTTHGCVPDTPAPPRLTQRNKTSLVLHWKAPLDNGSKITGYLLEWDEGKRSNAFRECYSGSQKQCRLGSLQPAQGYTFRLAARNDLGTSGFSEEVCFQTSGSAPPCPAPPRLLRASPSWLILQWARPQHDSSSDGALSYLLEMEEEEEDNLFRARYTGTELSCTVRNLCRGSRYRFRLFSCSVDGRSCPSDVVTFSTAPDRPGPPARLHARGDATAHGFTAAWDPPKESGGADVMRYQLEMAEGSASAGVAGDWRVVYTGLDREHTFTTASPGSLYRLRVTCVTAGGTSQCSELLAVETPAVAPGKCCPPDLAKAPEPEQLHLRWAAPGHDGGAPVSCYRLEMRPAAPVSEDEEGDDGDDEDGGDDGDDGDDGEAEEAAEGQQKQPAEAGAAEGTDDAATAAYVGPDTECVLESLLPGRVYTVRVRATNSAGHGEFSEFSEFRTAASCPARCSTPVVTSVHATCASVCWEETECNGAECSEYRLEWRGTGDLFRPVYCGLQRSYEVHGLVPATHYYCRVQAVNAVGPGPFSTEGVYVTPAWVPGAVPSLRLMDPEEEKLGSAEGAPLEVESQASPPSTCLLAGWEAPPSNGAPILGYTLHLIGRGQMEGEGSAEKAWPLLSVRGGANTRHVIRNLQPDTEYSVRVQAVNALGAGPLGARAVGRTRPQPPAPPRLECAPPGPHSLKLRWGESLGRPATGGAAAAAVAVAAGGSIAEPTHYVLAVEDTQGRLTVLYSGPCHTYKVQRLQESTEYRFRIQASNQAGRGPYSELHSFTTGKAIPPAPKAPRVTQLEGSRCEVSWDPVPPMSGDPLLYCLYLHSPRDSEYKQVYKGMATSFQIPGLHFNSEYRFRVCASRQSVCTSSGGDPLAAPTQTELVGQPSPSASFVPRRPEAAQSGEPLGLGEAAGPDQFQNGDERFAALILLGFGASSLFIAFIIQLLIM